MTIKDVARQCGVSVSTVSRVLNHHPDVSDAVRDRVMETVRTLHYVPNSSARDLVLPASDAIGLVVRGAGNPFFTQVVRAVEQEVIQRGYTLVLRQIQPGEDEVDCGAGIVRSKRLRGLILLGGCYDYTPERVASLDVPFVCCTYTNHFGTLDRNAFSSVSIDDQQTAYRAVRLLTEQGHRKIAILLDSIRDRSISELRYRGYRQALEEAGAAADPELVLETVDFEMDAAYAYTRRLLERRRDFTALFAVSDAMAIAAMKALHDGGMRVPEDCSVIAIDGIELSLYTIPTLTTLIQPQREMGTEAVRILADILEGRGGCRHVRTETELRRGGTVVRAKQRQEIQMPAKQEIQVSAKLKQEKQVLAEQGTTII